MPQIAGTGAASGPLWNGTPERASPVKIAQIAPLVESVPPRLYGGTERVVSWLTEELVRQGHEVTLFASGDSQTRAELAAVVPRALRLDGIHNSLPYNIIMLDQVASRMDEFDVLHFHIDFFHYPDLPQHGAQDPDHPAWPPGPARTARHLPRLSPHAAGLDLQPSAPAGAAGQLDGHGLSRPAGAAVPRRRRARAAIWPSWAASAPTRARSRPSRSRAAPASRSKSPPRSIRSDQAYFDAVVAPLIARSPHVEFIGEIHDGQKQEFLGNAGRCCFPSAGRSLSAW